MSLNHLQSQYYFMTLWNWTAIFCDCRFHRIILNPVKPIFYGFIKFLGDRCRRKVHSYQVLKVDLTLLKVFLEVRAPNLHQCLWTSLQYVDQKGLAAILTSIQSAGVAPEVNLRITQVRKHTSDRSTLVLKPRADVTRSQKQGYQWPHKKDMSSKILKKKCIWR